MEILALIAENPGRNWSEGEVYQIIRSNQQSVATVLRCFRTDRLLTGDATNGYRFSPEGPDAHRLASELAKLYRERRVAVIEAIYKSPLDPIRQFADAFRIRKDQS
jgi:hypothetical protein